MIHEKGNFRPLRFDHDDGGEEVALVVIQDPEYRRYKSTVDMDLAVKIYNVSHGGAARFWKL